MSYSTHNLAFGRYRDQQHADRLNDEARLANELQASLPGMTRTEALHEASRLIDKHGLGLTVVPRYHSTDATGATFTDGDRVAFSGAYLRAVQGHGMGHWRGTVIEAGGVLVRVEWDGQHRAGTPALARNLVRVDRMPFEPV